MDLQFGLYTITYLFINLRVHILFHRMSDIVIFLSVIVFGGIVYINKGVKVVIYLLATFIIISFIFIFFIFKTMNDMDTLHDHIHTIEHQIEHLKRQYQIDEFKKDSVRKSMTRKKPVNHES